MTSAGNWKDKRIAKRIAVQLWNRGRRAIEWPDEHQYRVIEGDLINPMDLLSVFPSLWVKPGWVLRSFVIYGGDSNGLVWAWPEELDFEKYCRSMQAKFGHEPDGNPIWKFTPPAGVRTDFMSAITGDNSPLAYFSASLFYRLAREIGAFWHGVNWGVYEMLPWDPRSVKPDTKVGRQIQKNFSLTDYEKYAPTDWRPLVRKVENQIEVQFVTYSELGQTHALLLTDLYNEGSYDPIRNDDEYEDEDETVIARGMGGFVF